MGNQPEIQKIYPLAPMQEGMLFHALLDEHSESYFEQMEITIKGKLDPELFERSFQMLVQRYEVFRTNFVTQKIQKPRQVVFKERTVSAYFEDIATVDERGQTQFIEEFKAQDRKRGFDLLKDILARAAIIRTGPESYRIIWSFHHIIMDGWCLSIVFKDLFTIYQSLRNNRPLTLEPVPAYSEYIQWLERQERDRAGRFWQNWLAGYEQTANITRLGRKGEGGQYQHGSYLFDFDGTLTGALEKMAGTNRVTLNSVFQSLWGLLLQRYFDVEDVVFGAVVSGRPPDIAGIEQMVGLFINTIPVRIKTSADDTFTSLLGRVQEVMPAAENYCYGSLADIQANTVLKQELFDHIVTFENYPLEKEFGGAVAEPELGFWVTDVAMFEQTNYNLDIVVVPGPELKLRLNFNRQVFEPEFIQRMAGHLKMLAGQAAAHPELPLTQISLLTKEETERIVFDFNRTAAEYPKNKSIHQLFEEQAARTPDDTAIVFGAKQMTFRELNARANQLAGFLRGKGVRPEMAVGLIAEHSPELITAILGILKAGGAYLPIDPGYPEERIRFILEDSHVSILLTTQRDNLSGVNFSGEIVNPDDPGLDQENPRDLEPVNTPEHLAYIIYTSGSTGKPKGVMVQQRGLVNYIQWAKKVYLGTEKLDFPLYSSISFDLTVTSIFLPLICGSRLLIYGREDQARLLERIIRDDQVLIIKLTPTHLRLLDSLDLQASKLRKLIVGGEDLKVELVRKISAKFNHPLEIYNEYGPTETVVGCMIYRYDPEQDLSGSVPIGVPAENVQIYLLNKYLQPVPDGVAGEIHISGDGVAKGYLGRPVLTAAKFLSNPFIPGTRMYKTQDLARRLPNGNIEFIGRSDHQVKIRGYRIEPGEIENRLLQYDPISAAVVVAKEETAAGCEGSKYLVAYLVTETELRITELKEFLGRELPEYMIPSVFITLPNLPVNANGKVDLKSLPEPENQINTGASYEPPADPEERSLTEIWQEIFGAKRIGVHDSFFDLGGHSLRAITLAIKTHKELNVQLPLKEIFKSPTIRGLARYIRDARKDPYTAIPLAEKKEFYPASSAQKRMFALSLFEEIGTTYNTPGAVLVEGDISKGQWEELFGKLIQRHESLRTSFEVIDHQVVQRIHPTVNFAVEYAEIGATGDPREIARRIREFIRPFNLRKAPLMRVGLIKLKQDRHILIYDLHHIITDGISQSILVRDLTGLYQEKQLPELRIQYKDFAEWQQKFLESERVKKQELYWLNRFTGTIPVLHLPTDFPRPATQSFEGANLTFQAGAELTAALKKLGNEYRVSLYMILLAAFTVLLAKYTRQRDIPVGTPVAGRPHADLEHMMGLFINTLVMRNYLNPNQTFGEFLEEVRKNTLEAFENQSYPFEQLVEKLQIRREANRNPMYDVLFALQNTESKKIKLPGLKITDYQWGESVARLDLLMIAEEQGDGLGFYIEYSSKLFAPETVERLGGHFISILEQIVTDPLLRISRIELLTGAVKKGKLAGTGTGGPGGKIPGGNQAEELAGVFEF